jgi:hypothetical protein
LKDYVRWNWRYREDIWVEIGKVMFDGCDSQNVVSLFWR